MAEIDIPSFGCMMDPACLWTGNCAEQGCAEGKRGQGGEGEGVVPVSLPADARAVSDERW
jgi:hypothetical protein